MKEALRWQPELEVGIDLIDNQHRILLDLANDLNMAHNAGMNMQMIDSLFNTLISFVFKHFETEEDLLQGDERYMQHCHDHYRLVRQLHRYLLDYRNGRENDRDPGTFLKTWLFEHFQEYDQPALGRQSGHDQEKLSSYPGPIDPAPPEELVQLDKADDELDLRAHKRIHSDSILDKEILAHCFNAVKMENSWSRIIDISSGGMKIYSNAAHDVGDLLIVTCDIGIAFKMKEKASVKNVDGNLYGLEFLTLNKEAKEFIEQLYGSVNLLNRPGLSR